MKNEHIMLKWIKNRTRRLSAPTGDTSCIVGAKDDMASLCGDSQKPLNNQVCPMCRGVKTTVEDLNGCDCGQVNLDSSDIIDYDTIKRQARRINSVNIKNNLKAALTPTTYLIPKGSPLCRSRSDVTGLKYTPIQRDLYKRLSPRSRAPILNPEEFAELCSEDDSSGYGDSESSGTSQSGYSSDDSLKNLLQSMVIKPTEKLEVSPPMSPCPVPKMGCRAMIQRSSSANGRRDVATKVAVRSQSLNRSAKPACGVKRSRSRATSFRKEQPGLSVFAQDDLFCGSGYLDSHIDQLAQIRTELQNLYALDKK